jgi:HrpA-like RNA helicase
MSDQAALQPRGTSRPVMRTAECKDCAREVRAGKREPETEFFSYPEAWAEGQLNRGGSRTDRCREHRERHQKNIAGLAVAYIDLRTVGEVADRQNPSGPLGGLGPLPEGHKIADTSGVDLGKFGFGMDEGHIRKILTSLANPNKRVLIVKAGTGTGKSTYMPYRLLDPPEDCFRLADLGPIVVTEPRVQATVGVAEFVGRVMSGAGGVGPGYPVGYQVSGDRQHDAACQLLYVTDGTMINWLREGRLSQIGTVIVDEAHERSTNIDFILGYLKRELPRYPHLRVIVTSATFNADFYQQFFGGEAVAGKIEVSAVKTIGYGWPLFPELDVMLPEEAELRDRWETLLPQLELADEIDEERLIATAWPQEAPPLKDDEFRNAEDAGYVENLHDTTRKLLPLRFQDPIPTGQWKTKMPQTLGQFVVKLAKGLDRAGIYGDILAFLPTTKTIEEACDIIRAGLGDRADIYALISSLPAEDKKNALEARCKGDRRKIVVSTNLAETSLTVEGVRFVVDSGLIAQSEWNPKVAQGGVRTQAHSQAGIRQRWGRVGRKAPGWVFPLYTKGQLLELAEDTDPGSTRDNLEQMVMTAKLGGIDNVVDFHWPAAFVPQPPVVLDEKAQEARRTFVMELGRANEALRAGGAVNDRGHPTSFGKELSRFPALGSRPTARKGTPPASCAVSIMYADRLGCVPEVATILALLLEQPLSGPAALLLDRTDWPDEWRFEAAERHRALASGCEDDAELVLQICASWERADRDRSPWEPSPARAAWARTWWVNDETLRAAAESRRDVLATLSPAMKEEVKRFIEPALLKRARGAISRAMPHVVHCLVEATTYRSIHTSNEEPGWAIVENSSVLATLPKHVIPLTRRSPANDQAHRISNLVAVEQWALADETAELRPTGPKDVMRLLALSHAHARPDTAKDILAATVESWPGGSRLQVSFEHGATLRVGQVTGRIEPHQLPQTIVEADPVDSDETEAGETATAEDAAPELDTSWPTPNAAQADPDMLARTAVLDSREIEAAEAACAICENCRAGNPQDCTSPVIVDDGQAADALVAWRERASLGIDVSSPEVEISDGDPVAGEWYELVGYRVAAGRDPVILLRRDWRDPDDERMPAEHPDLTPGQDVEVVVGPMVSDHGGPLRVFTRADGNGRFLLREAPTAVQRQEENGQLAMSLVRSYQGLLERLTEGAQITATAIPCKEPGCYTLTMVELLRQHFDTGNRDLAQRLPITLRDGQQRDVPFYPAVVASDPNRSGYVDAELLTRDDAIGVVHGAAFLTGDANRVAAPSVGSPVFLRLSNDSTRLSLRDVDLDPVRDIVSDERGVRLSAEVEGEETAGEDAENADTDGPDLGGFDTYLVSSRPVSTDLAVRLSALDPSADWQAAVWQFWCRSRHLHTDRRDPYRTGSTSTPIQLAPELRHPTPAVPGPSLEEAEQRYPPGTVATATITRVLDDGSRAWLALPDAAEATVTRQQVGPAGVLNLHSILHSDMEVTATVIAVALHRDKLQVQVELRDITPPPVLEQLVAADITPGRQLSGRITNVNPSFGLFVEVAPGLNGLVHTSVLPGGNTFGYEVGTVVDVEIVKVGENPKKPGQAIVGLRLTTSR